jgi:DNA-binding NarL/FixJ family response regulator
MQGSPTPVKAGALHVLYVEDDPMLRDMLATQLRAHRRIAGIEAFGSPREAIDGAGLGLVVDVALIDLALGQGQPSGIEVGLALRATRRDLPIVIFSQHRVPNIDDAVPPRERHGWSFVQKGSDVSIARLVKVLELAVAGQELVATALSARPAAEVLAQLTPRQREVMALAASGYDAVGIAERLHLAHVSVRRELSLAYRVLVPEPQPGTDLRTGAVLEYLRLMPAAGEPAAED